MATLLFDQIVFGPIHSRRLGSSLGVNILPYDGKLCSFDCIYCECGYNKDFRTTTKLPTHQEVKAALEAKLIALKEEEIQIDVITFAGNGEPTIHPRFAQIIDDAIELRDKYMPYVRISVLSNGMHLDKAQVVEALKKVDNNIIKLDAADMEMVRLIDRPNSPNYTIERQVELIKQFDGKFILQTMFVKGMHEGQVVDNTTPEHVDAWIKLVGELKPRRVMIYTIDRETPSKELEKVSIEELEAIGSRVEQLGIKINVAG